jgi:hypothetical protein
MTYRITKRYKTGDRLADSRIASLTFLFGAWVIRQFTSVDTPDGDKKPIEYGYALHLDIGTPGVKPLQLHLTSLTRIELEELKKFLNLAIDLAMPVVIERDRVARDAQEAGDDSYGRIYRALPTVVVRSGKIFTYREGVLYGPDGLPAEFGGRKSRSGHRGGTGGSGDGVADPEPQDAGAEDDQSKADQP